MSIEKRRFIRFSLDIPAYRFKTSGEVVRTIIRQISIGGCLADCDENVFPGDNFRLEIELPNKNRLPLQCKALYRFDTRGGVGSKFIGISRFEQELVGQVISQSLEDDGLPLLVDPFAVPPTYVNSAEVEKFLAERRREEEMVEDILSSEN